MPVREDLGARLVRFRFKKEVIKRRNFEQFEEYLRAVFSGKQRVRIMRLLVQPLINPSGLPLSALLNVLGCEWL